MDDLICRHCGLKLAGPGHPHTFIALGRTSNPRSPMNEVVCTDGECLNAAGYVTKHNPIGYPFDRS